MSVCTPENSAIQKLSIVIIINVGIQPTWTSEEGLPAFKEGVVE